MKTFYSLSLAILLFAPFDNYSPQPECVINPFPNVCSSEKCSERILELEEENFKLKAELRTNEILYD